MAYKPKEKILTAGELCKWWNITPEQLDKLRRAKNLPYVEIGKGTYLFREKSIAKWYESVERVFDRSKIRDKDTQLVAEIN